jgi:hypothetical protein
MRDTVIGRPPGYGRELESCYVGEIRRYDCERARHHASQLIMNTFLGRCSCIDSLPTSYTMRDTVIGRPPGYGRELES